MAYKLCIQRYNEKSSSIVRVCATWGVPSVCLYPPDPSQNSLPTTDPRLPPMADRLYYPPLSMLVAKKVQMEMISVRNLAFRFTRGPLLSILLMIIHLTPTIDLFQVSQSVGTCICCWEGQWLSGQS